MGVLFSQLEKNNLVIADCNADLYLCNSRKLCSIHIRYRNGLNAIANSFLRHSYTFSFQRLIFSIRTLIFPIVEFFSFHHGGKNKRLLRFSLTVAAKRDKSGDAAT